MMSRKLSVLCSVSALALITACSSNPPRNDAVFDPASSTSNAVTFGNVSNIEIVSVASRTSGGGAILGAVIGGVLGNQVGDGRGRQVARAAGVIIGGAIGHNVSRQRQRQRYGNERVYERCETRYRDSYEERVDGYEVTYEYAGRRHVTRMPNDPGERIRVRVDVTPTVG